MARSSLALLLALVAGRAAAWLAEAGLEAAEISAGEQAFEAFTKEWTRPHSSIWKPMEQGPANGRNLCLDGKQLPDFYVLGVQKCATSSLAVDLTHAGISHVHGDMNHKEFHWFDHKNNYSLIGVEGDDTNRGALLEWMPQCPQGKPSFLAWGAHQEARRVALADFTPDYLRVVPLPTDLVPAGDGWLDVNKENRSMPTQLRRLYGYDFSEKLKFAVMIRDPLSQMQSAWYHAKRFNFLNACRSCKAPSFKEALRSLVGGLSSSPPQYTAWLWTVLYARQLKVWFNDFKPSQFHIIPVGEYVVGDKDRICWTIAANLGFKIDCDSKGAEATHAWSHPHPKLEDDAPADLKRIFDQFMAKETKSLVTLLAEAQEQGLTLASYDGRSGNEVDVMDWLLSKW